MRTQRSSQTHVNLFENACGLEFGSKVRVLPFSAQRYCDSGHLSNDSQEVYPDSHTVSLDNSTNEQMVGTFNKASCSDSDYKLTASLSRMLPNPSGQKEIPFAKGTEKKSLFLWKEVCRLTADSLAEAGRLRLIFCY